MAKKIIISFLNNPAIGFGINCIINYNDLPILFNSGESSIAIEYIPNGTPDLPPSQIERQLTLDATINKTLAFFNLYYYNDNVIYNRVNDTIEVIVTLDNVDFLISNTNADLIINTEDIDPSENLNLRYFFQYTNMVNDTFICQIYKKRYIGVVTEINGTATLEKGSVKNHTDSIRGTGLSIELEANLDLTLEDLYTENEQDFTVVFIKNGTVIFRGFLKPDGVFQSYSSDFWIISLDCVDGLGALSNLSFVKENGFRFNGKLKALDIIYFALKRTGILMPINTSINVLYDGLPNNDNTDVLNNIYINSDRFFKEDSQGSGDGTIMSCEEVLQSILGVFRANITQENGEWYIYKADEIFNDAYVLFRRYDITNTYVGNKTLNLNKTIGSQIDNFYPHFSDRDQKIQMNGSINAFRLGYKYGFLNGLLPNGKLERDGIDFEQWTPNFATRSLIIDDPQKPNGLILKTAIISDTEKLLILSSTPIVVDAGNFFDVKFNLELTGGKADFYFRVIVNGNYLTNDGIWSTNPNTYITITVQNEGLFISSTATFKISTSAIPVDGNLIVEIYKPRFRVLLPFSTYRPNGIINSIDVTTNSIELEGKVGEFHTVERTQRVSSIIKENVSVIIGDETDNFYSGTIFKTDMVTPTEKWSRSGTVEGFPLLRISAETELRLGQKPLKVFTGSVFGYVPYLTFLKINNLDGLFMAIEYFYDTKANKVKFKLLELIANEISDINYKPTFDYGGNTVKPTIKG